jgi:hypothetical protein
MISTVVGWLSELSLLQLGLALVSTVVGGYIGAMALIGWLKNVVMKYALKKLVAFGLLSSVGAELIPGFSLIETVVSLLPI